MHNFFPDLKPYLRPADKNIVVFTSGFMHYHLDMRLLPGNHNLFCDIHIFSAKTTTAEALLFSIQKLTIVECSGHVQIKLCVVVLCKENFVWPLHAKIRFCVFSWHNWCNNFFRSSVCATKIYLKVLRIDTKYCCKL